MKVQVRIDERTYDVEIPDLQARPVVAIVDGQMVEVWPDNSARAEPAASLKDVKPAAKTERPLAPRSPPATAARRLPDRRP